MENRRTIRNWDAFGRIFRFTSRLMATEMVEPVLKLVFDISAALLLAVTFVFQTLSVLIAFDVVVVGFYHLVCTQLCKIMSALLFFTTNEREKNAAMNAMIRFFSNVLWVRLIYTVHKDCWVYMAGGPLLCIALMHTLVHLYTERLSTEQSALTQITYSLFLLSLFLMVFNTIGGAPDHILMETVFLLRTPIDTLCNAVDTVFKLFDSVLAVDNNMPVYTTQIARFSFWTSVHLLQFLLVVSGDRNGQPSRRGDRLLYFALFLHDLLDLLVPVKQLLTQIRHERIIAKTFPRISALELSNLNDETCSVCLSQHNAETVRLGCNHLLHAQCLHRILQQTAESHSSQPSRCPMCRATIVLPNDPRTGAASVGLFGPGTRGSRTRAFNHPLYNYIVGESNAANNALAYTTDGDGTPRAGNAQQLIAEHLGQHNLQQGDVIHIRIIPRRARQQVAAAVAAAAAASTATANTNTGTVINAAGTIGTAGAAPASTPSATSSPTPRAQRPPTRLSEIDADILSTLQGIHTSGLYSESDSNSATNSATSSAAPSAHPSSSDLPARPPSQGNYSSARVNVRNRSVASSTLCTLVSSLSQSGHPPSQGARVSASVAEGAVVTESTVESIPMDVVSDVPMVGDAGLTGKRSANGERRLSSSDILQVHNEAHKAEIVDLVSESDGDGDDDQSIDEDDQGEGDDAYSSTAHSSDTDEAHLSCSGALLPEECAELAQILYDDAEDDVMLSGAWDAGASDDADLPLTADNFSAVGHKRSRSEAELILPDASSPFTQLDSAAAAVLTSSSGAVAAVAGGADVSQEVICEDVESDSDSVDEISPSKRPKWAQPQVDTGCTQCSSAGEPGESQ